jgi:hypothetical protein
MGKIFGILVTGALCFAGIGLAADLFRPFAPALRESTLFFLGMFPMLAIAILAGQSRQWQVEWLGQVIRIFSFIGAWFVISSYPNPILILAFVGAFGVMYLRPLLTSINYLFVRRPLEQQALKQHMLDQKLEADAAVAEATLRRERARAALEDAEQEYRDINNRLGSNR